jgi:quinol monooxygenase YgiN
MIKHIVMWNVSGESPDEKGRSAMLVKQKFEQLRGKIPGLLHLEVGIDVSGISYACDVVLYSEFVDAAALAAYAQHPAHLDIRDQLDGIRIARHQVDYPAE